MWMDILHRCGGTRSTRLPSHKVKIPCESRHIGILSPGEVKTVRLCVSWLASVTARSWWMKKNKHLLSFPPKLIHMSIFANSIFENTHLWRCMVLRNTRKERVEWINGLTTKWENGVSGTEASLQCLIGCFDTFMELYISTSLVDRDRDPLRTDAFSTLLCVESWQCQVFWSCHYFTKRRIWSWLQFV